MRCSGAGKIGHLLELTVFPHSFMARGQGPRTCISWCSHVFPPPKPELGWKSMSLGHQICAKWGVRGRPPLVIPWRLEETHASVPGESNASQVCRKHLLDPISGSEVVREASQASHGKNGLHGDSMVSGRKPCFAPTETWTFSTLRHLGRT